MNLVDPVGSRRAPRPNGIHRRCIRGATPISSRSMRASLATATLRAAPPLFDSKRATPKATQSSLGTAPVEPDGSFFVQVPGDRPIRFALLDGKGAVLRQEHGWFWARCGEQRICVGCHTGPEHAAENRVPAVLLRTTTPVDLDRCTEDPSGTDSCGGRQLQMKRLLLLCAIAGITAAPSSLRAQALAPTPAASAAVSPATASQPAGAARRHPI